MFKKFSTKQLVFIALMAALLLIVNLALGGALVALTGIPLINGVVTAITFGLFLILMVRMLPKFGTFTLFLLIYAILEIPTSLGGAPGFWPKVPINVLTGLVADIFLLIFAYRKWAQYIGFYVLVTVNTFVFIYFLSLFNVPGVNKLLAVLWWYVPLYWILGTIGIFIGVGIYNKIKNKQTAKQISN